MSGHGYDISASCALWRNNPPEKIATAKFPPEPDIEDTWTCWFLTAKILAILDAVLVAGLFIHHYLPNL